VQPADHLKLRWVVSTDGCNGRIGWYLDDIRIYDCGPCLESLQLSGVRNYLEILFQAGTAIQSSEHISDHADITYSPGNHLDLVPGFFVELGSEVNILTKGCELPSLSTHPGSELEEISYEIENIQDENKIKLVLNKSPAKVLLRIYNQQGQLVEKIRKEEPVDKNSGRRMFEINNLPKGLYSGQIIIDKKITNFNFSIR
jgi:hypothetical protein